MRRVETGETYVGEVPLELFRGEAFKGQLYLERVAELVLRGVEALNVSKEEPIRICKGYVLSKAREVLEERGFKVVHTRIRGETQALAEGEFIRRILLIFRSIIQMTILFFRGFIF